MSLEYDIKIKTIELDILKKKQQLNQLIKDIDTLEHEIVHLKKNKKLSSRLKELKIIEDDRIK